MKSFFPILIYFLSFSLYLSAQEHFDCFSVLVGKDATHDGSVMLAHNEDDWGDRIVNWYKVPASKHTAGETIILKNGGKLDQSAYTYNYLWLEMPEMEFSDSYMNEWGVTIGSDACRSKEKDPELFDGGIGYWLRRAMAERAKTAREAVRIGGALVEKYGYTSSGRTYCIADDKEAWMLSVVKGKHWVAQRVPDDHIAIIPNYYTITSVDLSDSINFYGSSDLIQYAIKKRWYNPKKDGDFNFRLAYSDEGNLENMGNIVRHWSALNLISEEQLDVKDSFPFSFKPKRNVSLQDLFEILRNHNEGSEFDKSDHYTNGSPHDQGRAICSKTTQYGFVAQLRKDLPKEFASVMWLAPFRTCVHSFTQWYIGMNDIPDGFAEGNYRSALEIHFNPIENVFEYAPENSFLKFVKHAKTVDHDYGLQINQIQKTIKTFEAELLQNQSEFEKKMVALHGKDSRAVKKSITDYCHKQIMKSLKLIE